MKLLLTFQRFQSSFISVSLNTVFMFVQFISDERNFVHCGMNIGPMNKMRNDDSYKRVYRFFAPRERDSFEYEQTTSMGNQRPPEKNQRFYYWIQPAFNKNLIIVWYFQKVWFSHQNFFQENHETSQEVGKQNC
jgi:hypothetical protein